MGFAVELDKLENILVTELNMPIEHSKKLVDDLKYIKSLNIFKDVYSIVLFGSCSKGKAKRKSDIDLCVVFDKNLDRNETFQIRPDLNDDSKFGVETNAVLLFKDSFLKYLNSNRFYREIDEGINLYIKD